MDRGRQIDNAQNVNARWFDKFNDSNKTSVKTTNPPGGKSSFSLGWTEPEPIQQKKASNFNDNNSKNVNWGNFNKKGSDNFNNTNNNFNNYENNNNYNRNSNKNNNYNYNDNSEDVNKIFPLI